MIINWKEASKFFAGFATHAMLFHGTLALSGHFKLFYSQLTNFGLNLLSVFCWFCILVVAAYYGWVRK